jgi:hypothetical protein
MKEFVREKVVKLDLTFLSEALSLVSIRNTTSGAWVLRSLFKALTAEGLPSPLQFQDRSFIEAGWPYS